MRVSRGVALLGIALVIGACGQFDAPNQNASDLAELTGNPSKVALATAAQGLFSGIRSSVNALSLGVVGREAYSLDVSNPQAVPRFYTQSGQFTGNWNGAYTNGKQADIVIAGAENSTSLTAEEKAGFKGFAKTVKAYLLFMVIRETDVGGAALEPLASPTDDPPPIASKAEVYAHILQLLDDAKTDLEAAGATLPFQMTTGFADFGTPAGLIEFNRAIRAKVDITMADTGNVADHAALYTAALADLNASFLDPSKPMDFGAYNTYSANSGDVLNPYYDPTARQRYAHFSLYGIAQVKTPGGEKDDRFTSKVYSLLDSTKTPGVDTAFARYGFPVAWAFSRYATNTTPVPVIKNEELILLRAEAELGLGQTSAAIADINLVRSASGGLPDISDPYVPDVALNQPATLLDELLYEKLFSLLYENGDHWIDFRRYGKLATLPRDRTGDLIWQNTRIPVNECVPRTPQPAGCTMLPGL